MGRSKGSIGSVATFKGKSCSTISTVKMGELCNIWLPITGILNSCPNLEDVLHLVNNNRNFPCSKSISRASFTKPLLVISPEGPPYPFQRRRPFTMGAVVCFMKNEFPIAQCCVWSRSTLLNGGSNVTRLQFSASSLHPGQNFPGYMEE